MEITRRDFFVKTLQGAAIIAVPAVLSEFIQSCNSNSTSPSGSSTLPVVQGTVSNRTVTVPLDASSPLAKVGGAALITSSLGPLLVDHPDAATYNVLTAICTHQGCTVNGYDTANQEFVCPCHGSRYSIAGQVVQGPAPAPLTRFTGQVSNNQLVISV
jgi:cytochrome b6-f complex iron-sulfur subunit